jgi:purine-binding chemotaxis protein CheW
MSGYVLFAIGDVEFGIDVDRIVEVRNPGYISTVPDLPDYFPGLINVRGEFVPLADMRKRFSLENPYEKRRTLLVRVGGEKIALMVDEVKGIIDFEDEEIGVPPSVFRGLKNKYLEGLGRKGERVVILLDLEKLITSRERIMLETAKESIKSAKA